MKNWLNDHKYTAYVLGEVNQSERETIEREMQDNPEVRAHVEELRAFTKDLEQVFATEPDVGLESKQRAAILTRARKRADGKLLRLPVWTITWVTTAAATLVIGIFAVRYHSDQQAAQIQRLAAVERGEHWPTVRDIYPQAKVVMIDEITDLVEMDALVFDMDIAIPEPAMSSLEGLPAPSSQPAEQMEFAALDIASVESPLVMRGLHIGRSEPGRHQIIRRHGGGVGERLMGEGFAPQPFLSPSIDDFPERRDHEFLRVADHPLSTFSIDVDTASYTVVRQFLSQGRMPPTDAVRVEEMINYFAYDYAPPTDETPFKANFESAPAPWQPDHQLVRIALKGKEIAAEERPPLNLVYLIDVSGSMSPSNRLPLVKRGLMALAQQLDERDHIAIVVYAGASGIALPPTRGDQTEVIADALNKLRAAGGTAGGEGIQTAYRLAREQFDPEAVNRVILCTDGDFNVGITQRGDLERLIEKEAESGVFLTVLGFGMGNYKDSTLEVLSNKGNGNYAYIDTFSEARRVLVDQMTGTLITIAKDVKIQVEFNPEHVAGYRLIGYENRMLRREDFNDDAVDAGEIGAGHTVTAFYELIPAGKSVTDAPPVDELKYQSRQTTPEEPAHDEWMTVKMRYKEPDGETSRKLEFPLNDSLFRSSTPSRDYRFATAVAAFGQWLRENEQVGDFGCDRIIQLAEESVGDDPGGYRREFLDLVRNARAVAGR